MDGSGMCSEPGWLSRWELGSVCDNLYMQNSTY